MLFTIMLSSSSRPEKDVHMSTDPRFVLTTYDTPSYSPSVVSLLLLRSFPAPESIVGGLVARP